MANFGPPWLDFNCMKSCWWQTVSFDGALGLSKGLRWATKVVDASLGPLGRGRGSMMPKRGSDGKSMAAMT